MNKIFFIIILFISSCLVSSSQINPKFNKWNSPSYFRGYNILFESPHTFQDFMDFKNYGGNLFQIGVFGWMKEDSPYGIQQMNIDSTDRYINYCRQSGIHYVLAVRSGPGAYDSYQESHGNTGESRIWNTGNTTEQNLYCQMLKMMITRYYGDSLFVGINLVVEPRPKVNFIPANTSDLYKRFLERLYNIHMDQVYNLFVSAIRSIDLQIPIIIENFAYSTPELFPSYVINDPYIIYSAHNYMPKEYTNADPEFSSTYPGTFWSITYLALKYYDAQFIRNTVFSRLLAFQQSVNSPIFIGELGMMYPQNGSRQYFRDILNLIKDYGWHWALWDWRRGQGKQWNIESFNDDSLPTNGVSSWTTVLGYFNAPPIPKTISPPYSYIKIPKPVIFSFDSLTSYSKYDIEVYDANTLIGSVNNFSKAHWSYPGGPFENGITYRWRVRSKNPGGKPENISSWSDFREFFIPVLSTYHGSKPISLENFPNPFNPITNINFSVVKTSKVVLNIYDIRGRLVKTLINEIKENGVYQVSFDGTNLSSGIYFCRLNTNSIDGKENITKIRRLILTK